MKRKASTLSSSILSLFLYRYDLWFFLFLFSFLLERFSEHLIYKGALRISKRGKEHLFGHVFWETQLAYVSTEISETERDRNFLQFVNLKKKNVLCSIYTSFPTVFVMWERSEFGMERKKRERKGTWEFGWQCY